PIAGARGGRNAILLATSMQEVDMSQAPALETFAFERSHDIVIDAPAAVVFDYVTNPQSWPEWIAVSHRVESADRPLVRGETFREQWFSRHEVQLDWIVLEADWPRRWVA